MHEQHARNRAIATQLSMFMDQQIWCVTRPTRRPNDRYSLPYCLFLAKSPRIRAEVMYRQRYKCWECGMALRARWVHLHHPLDYASTLGQEEATSLVAVHSECHGRIHIRAASARFSSQCGCVTLPGFGSAA